jgi:ADP-L-glycero-D-manno-heptose 6-epimerase
VYGLNLEFKETSPVDPRTPYAWSKYLFERYINENKWNIIIQGFRYFNVYGPGEEHKGSQASPYTQFAKQSDSGLIKLFDNSKNYHRDFIHVDRIIEIHEKFLDIKQSGLWNAGTGKTQSFFDIANEISIKKPSIIEWVAMPNNLKHSYQEYTCADLTHLNNTLNEKNNS